MLDFKNAIKEYYDRERKAVERFNLDDINVESYKSFESLIYAFSKRKCFNSENLTLNYDEYDKFEINYELIEKYLTKCLLYKKKSFNKDLRFINYKLESSDESFSSNLNQLISTMVKEKQKKNIQ